MIYIITGGIKGLGRELSVGLLKKGHTVFSLYNNDHKAADDFKNFAIAHQFSSHILALDLTKADEISNFVQSHLTSIDQPLCLIHCASAHFEIAPAQQWTDHQIQNLLNINVITFFNFSKILFPILKKNKGSLLVGILSETISSAKPSKGFCGYNVAKMALKSLLECFSVEWEKTGVKTISFLPGSMDSGIFQRWPDHIQNLVSQGTPLSTHLVAEKMIDIILDYDSIKTGGCVVISE